MPQVENERRFRLEHQVLERELQSRKVFFAGSAAGAGVGAVENVKSVLDEGGIRFSASVDGISEMGSPARDPACAITVCVAEKDFSKAMEVHPYRVPNQK